MARRKHHGVIEQAKASKHRRDDAQALFDARRWRGAMYLGGYAVECLLKTKLMRMFGSSNLEQLEQEMQKRGLLAVRSAVFTHQLEELLRLARGWNRLRLKQDLWASFTVVNRWLPSWRYSPDLANEIDANVFLDAVDEVLRWVDNNI